KATCAPCSANLMAMASPMPRLAPGTIAILFSSNFMRQIYELLMNRPPSRLTALLIAFAVETLSVTWCLKLPGWAPWLSIPYFGAGIAIAILLLFAPALRLPSPGPRPLKAPLNHYRLFITGAVALMLYSWCLYWFEE